MAEPIPARVTLKSAGELRHYIAIPEQDPIQRLAACDQFGAILGEDDVVDHRVDRGIPDARKVARTGPGCRLRPEEITLLVARRKRLWPRKGGHIEVEAAQAILVLDTVNQANIHGHAEPLQICLLYTSPSPRDRQKSR